MTKWEYCYIVVDFSVVVEINGQEDTRKTTAYSKISELGQDGWEMVNVTHYAGARSLAIFFKRPLP